MSFKPRALSLTVLLSLAVACSSSSEKEPGGTNTPANANAGTTPSDEASRPVIQRYAEVVYGSYADALGMARELQSAVSLLVTEPSQENLDAARKAWLAARDVYGQTEAFRFYGGPIDAEDGPEGRINGWPLDENFIDYTKDEPDAGLINQPAELPTIDASTIAEKNESGGEKNLSTGYHAIEFLLWGQDQSATTAGTRPYTDYVVGAVGTAKNQDRRGAYLKATADLLVSDLESVLAKWELADPASYGATFVALPEKDAIERIVKGLAGLSGVELSRERMGNAYETQDQEEEHSCFSDNTKADLVANLAGVENVWAGRYHSEDGPGLDELVAKKDAALAAKVGERLARARTTIEAIPLPFDQALVSEPGRTKIREAMIATKELTDALLEVSLAFGVVIHLEQ